MAEQNTLQTQMICSIFVVIWLGYMNTSKKLNSMITSMNIKMYVLKFSKTVTNKSLLKSRTEEVILNLIKKIRIHRHTHWQNIELTKCPNKNIITIIFPYCSGDLSQCNLGGKIPYRNYMLERKYFKMSLFVDHMITWNFKEK